jgi:hypothetical protein
VGLPIVSGACPNFLIIPLKKMKILCRYSGSPWPLFLQSLKAGKL